MLSVLTSMYGHCIQRDSEEVPECVIKVLQECGHPQYVSILGAAGCHSVQELTSAQSLVDVGVKYFHAQRIAIAAKKYLTNHSDSPDDSGPEVAESTEEVVDKPEEEDLPLRQLKGKFHPPSWKFIQTECKQFSDFKDKTGEGLRNFVGQAETLRRG